MYYTKNAISLSMKKNLLFLLFIKRTFEKISKCLQRRKKFFGVIISSQTFLNLEIFGSVNKYAILHLPTNCESYALVRKVSQMRITIFNQYFSYRVCIGRNSSSNCIEVIHVTQHHYIFNFWLALSAWPSQPKIPNCGGTMAQFQSQNTHCVKG